MQTKDTILKLKSIKENLELQFDTKPWFRGFSISRDANGFFLNLNVSSLKALEVVPEQVDGIRINVRVIKVIKVTK